MEQGKKSNVKKIVWATILFFVFVAGLVLAIIYMPYFWNKMAGRDDQSALIVFYVLWVVAIGAAVSGAHFLTARCLNGWLSKTLYAITFLPYWLSFGVVFVIVGIMRGAKKVWDEIPASTSSSSSDKPDYEIRDESGNSRTLSYDKYVGEYRDSSGRVWKSKDGGKTFYRDK